MNDNTEVLKRIDELEKIVLGQRQTIVDLIEAINKYTYAVQEAGLYNKRIVEEQADIKSKDANIENVLLYSKKGVSVRKQAALLGCSEKTIYNYRDKLRAQGRLD